MSQISKRLLNRHIEDKIQSLLQESFTLCSNHQLTSDFLTDILTPTEKTMIAKRLAIAYLLVKGLPYRTINQTLKVSNPTIRTVALMLQYKGEGIRVILKQISNRQEWKKIFEELAETAIEIVGMGKRVNRKETK